MGVVEKEACGQLDVLILSAAIIGSIETHPSL